jgi:hypothetical protein
VYITQVYTINEIHVILRDTSDGNVITLCAHTVTTNGRVSVPITHEFKKELLLLHSKKKFIAVATTRRLSISGRKDIEKCWNQKETEFCCPLRWPMVRTRVLSNPGRSSFPHIGKRGNRVMKMADGRAVNESGHWCFRGMQEGMV